MVGLAVIEPIKVQVDMIRLARVRHVTFNVPVVWQEAFALDARGMVRLVDGAVEVSLKSTNLAMPTFTVSKESSEAPIPMTYLRRSFNDECAIFGANIPIASSDKLLAVVIRQ